jgi:hypothetical protein
MKEKDEYPAPCSLPIELDGVSEALEYGKGVWNICSGCHESNEGYPTGPYSSIMRCHLGGGCYECGGIGAIWDRTDYSNINAHRPMPDLTWLTNMSSEELGDAIAFLTVDQRETLRKFIWSTPSPEVRARGKDA